MLNVILPSAGDIPSLAREWRESGLVPAIGRSSGYGERLSQIELCALPFIPLFNRPQVPHDSGIDLRLAVAHRASSLVPVQVPVEGQTLKQGKG